MVHVLALLTIIAWLLGVTFYIIVLHSLDKVVKPPSYCWLGIAHLKLLVLCACVVSLCLKC